MRSFSRLFFTLGILAWSSHSYAEADYTLTVTEISVKETRTDGKQWDIGLGESTQPDLHLMIKVDEQPVLTHSFDENKSRVIRHITSSSFNMNPSGAKVHIELSDHDLQKSELIGSLDFEIKKEQIDEVITLQNEMILIFKVKVSLTRAGKAVLAQQEAQEKAKAAEAKAKVEADAKQAAEEKAQRAIQAAQEAKAKAQAEEKAKQTAQEKANNLEQKMKLVKEVLLQEQPKE
jgi:chemotaxis protein histidine kinase CheA